MGLCEGVFGITCFMEKILTIMWCCRKLSLLWCLGCNWGEEELKGKWLGKAKRKDSQKYGGTEWKNVFFFVSVFYFNFVFIQYDVC